MELGSVDDLAVRVPLTRLLELTGLAYWNRRRGAAGPSWLVARSARWPIPVLASGSNYRDQVPAIAARLMTAEVEDRRAMPDSMLKCQTRCSVTAAADGTHAIYMPSRLRICHAN